MKDASLSNVYSPQWVDASEDLVRGLYLGLLDREPDLLGAQHWITQIQSGASIDTIVMAMMQSAEYKQRKAQGVGNQFFDINQKMLSKLKNIFINDPVVIAHIGARDKCCQEHPYPLFDAWHVHNNILIFEPLLNYTLNSNKKYTSEVRYFSDFIGNGETQEFYLNEPQNTSSLLPLNRQLIDHFVDLCERKTIEIERVPTITIDDALKDIKNIDLLKLDIQGFELQALQKATQTLMRTGIVQCTVSFHELYLGQALFNEVEQFLKTQGFELVDINHGTRYSLIGTTYTGSPDLLCKAEAIFFRRLERCEQLRRISSRALLALMIYQKPSLTSWLLKSNAELSDIFVDSMKSNKNKLQTIA